MNVEGWNKPFQKGRKTAEEALVLNKNKYFIK